MFKTQRRYKVAKLSIAPLLDMIFILLIFFVVSTSFSKLPGVLIERPEATVSDQLPAQNILVGITKTGAIYIGDDLLNMEMLKSRLQVRFLKDPKLTVLLVADRLSVLKDTIQVMDICKQIGIKRVAVAEDTQP